MNPSERTIFELFDLTGRTALVTGASGWLGRAIANSLAEANCTVIVSSRLRETAIQVASQLHASTGVTHHGIELDQTNLDSIADGFSQATDLHGSVDILVNNGLEIKGGDLTEVSFEEFHRHQINNAGYFELARRTRDHAVTMGRSANVVMVGSMYGMVGSYPDAYEDVCAASPVAYHTLKGGTLQMVRHLAVYWAKDNIRVNALSPGPFPSPQAPQEMIERLKTKSPMQRMGKPFELKGALLLLVSDAGSYITGQNIVVDGGWTAW